MLFNSFQFVIFFTILVVLFYAIPFKWKWLLLLIASCYFYIAYIPVYILILAFTITVDYFVGVFLEKATARSRKPLLIISIIANIGLLFFFKYYAFFTENISFVLSHMGYRTKISPFNLILPIGLSFHTFQSLSYIIEVYRGNQKAEKHFGIYALYVMFFPQLVAGPIERPQNMLHQFYEDRKFNPDDITAGLTQMLRGFFKKLVVADRLAIYVNAVYNRPASHNGISLITATIFFAFQIYCDFSGYSDIAIGAARILGYKLVTNFNNPYLARNINEFWKRWHISLTTWFRDYLYIPLGGNRVQPMHLYFNLLLVFTISGLWHGASWNFILWGLLNGLYLVFLRITWKFWPRFYTLTGLDKLDWLKIPLQMTITTVFVSLSWVFFRANNIHDAAIIFKQMSSFKGHLFTGGYTFHYCLIAILILLLYEIKAEYFEGSYIRFKNTNYLFRSCYYALVVVTIAMLGVFDGGQFIYFQF